MEARRRIRETLRRGVTRFSRHALEELHADGLTTMDCEHVLRGGWVEPGELVHGTWRYRVRTPRACVVVAFRPGLELVVVTAWRE